MLAVQSTKKMVGVPATSAPIEHVFSHTLYGGNILRQNKTFLKS